MKWVKSMKVTDGAKPRWLGYPTKIRFIFLYGGLQVGALILVALLAADIIFVIINLSGQENAQTSTGCAILNLISVQYLLRKALLSFLCGILYAFIVWHVKIKK